MRLKLKYVVNGEVFNQLVKNAYIHENTNSIYIYSDEKMSSKLEKVVNMSASAFVSAEVLE